MTEEQRQDWEERKYNEFLELDFNTDMLPIIKKCYSIASNDINLKIPYSSIILKNVNYIVKKENMEISYQQWKSFMGYYNSNCINEVVQNNLLKLGIK